MPVVLRPPTDDRERIMFYGGGGVGKTYASLQLAAATLGPDDRLHVIDFDNLASRIISGGTFGDALKIGERWRGGRCVNDTDGNVIIYTAREWDDLDWIVPKFEDTANYDDWGLVDSVSRPWEEVQNWYVKFMYGDDLADWLVEFKRELLADKNNETADTNQAFSTRGAWQAINKQWAKLVKIPLLTMPPCHMIVTAEEKPLRTQTMDKGKDSEELAGMYRHVGVKPDTQRSVGHKVATVIHLTKGKTEDPPRYMTTIKDAGYEDRGLADRDEWTDMATTLLVGKHGWTKKRA